MNGSTSRLFLGFFLASVFTVSTATAVPRYWQTEGTGPWEDPSHWGGTVPQAGDDVVITNAGANVILSGASPALNSVTLSATLTVTNWTTALTATDVTVMDGGIITLPPAFDETQMSNRVWIVCSNLTVQAGGALDVTGKGYMGGPPGSGQSGSGPGGGVGGRNPYAGGGGYGGRGGWGYLDEWKVSGGTTYATAAEPFAPGSGGGTRADSQAYGGDGGGAIRIDATGDVVVDGSLLADGTDANYYSGGGSGGGIWISCRRFGGNGTLRANGGERGNYGGSGGGGRIALDYQQRIGTPSVKMEVREGSNAVPFDEGILRWPEYRWVAEPGTIHLGTLGLLTPSISNLYGRVSVNGVTEWMPESLTVNATRLGFPPGFRLTVTNGVTVQSGGALEMMAGAELFCGGDLRLDDGQLILNGFTQMTCQADLVVTNGGAFFAHSAPTHGSTPHGALVDVAGDIRVAPASRIFPANHITNGGAVRFRAQRILVAEGGGFDADGRGFGGGLGLIHRAGYGPGGGVAQQTYGSGAGYGGRGGDAFYNGWDAVGGAPYGHTNAPVTPGSGGAGHSNNTRTFGGNGGGTIWLEATDTMDIDGTLSANGGRANYAGGGGSGGGIFLAAPSFQGGETAVLRADGSAGLEYGINASGPGGGGRIAIAVGLSEAARETLIENGTLPGLFSYDLDPAYAGSFSVRASSIGPDYETWGPERAPGDGTYRFITTNVTLHIDGDPDRHGTPVPISYGGTPYLSIGATITNSVASPADELDGQRWVCLGWTLSDANDAILDSGTTPQAVFTLSATRNLTWHWTNEFLLAVSSSSSEQGSVRTDANGWHTNGTVIANLWANPEDDFQFTEWTGDVPAGHATDNPLTVTMDRPRALVAQFASSEGMIRTWNGTGAWETPENWTPEGMPGPYDHAIVASGEAWLSMPRVHGNVTISNNASLVFTNWTTSLTASNVTVLDGGLITLPPAFDNTQMSNRVWIVCTNLTVDSGGILDADGKGYSGAHPGEDYLGYGPGGGAGGSGAHGGGGGYGGRGSWSYPTLNEEGGPVYATAAEPAAPGSGGGSRQEVTAYGGHGGGAIRIRASGDVLVEGTIRANGTQGNYYSGGGSGGGIWISCHRFGGNGTLQANGGPRADNGGPGGGGRIALHYDERIGDPGIRLEARNGENQVSSWHNDWLRWPQYWAAEPGTVYLSDSGLLGPVITNLYGRLAIPGFASWSPPSLTVANDAWIRFGPDFHLDVADALDVQSGGTLELMDGGLLTCGGVLKVDGGALVMNTMTQMTCRADLVVNNGGRVYAYSAPTNGTAPYGASVDVGGDLRIGPNSWIHPDACITNGGPVRFRAERVIVAENGGFDADHRGFGGPYGVWRADGYGPGAGVRVGYGSGAGYGGRGGDAHTSDWDAPGGPAYGNPLAPVMPGSGGGTWSGGFAGHGGGVVWIEAAQSVTLDGILSANGMTTESTASGGGSGGGIFVSTPRFTGGETAALRADGGGGQVYNAGSNAAGGAGGGGRIAVILNLTPEKRDQLLSGEPVRMEPVETLPTFFGAASVEVGATGPDYTGAEEHAPAEGTVVFMKGGERGTLLILH